MLLYCDDCKSHWCSDHLDKKCPNCNSDEVIFIEDTDWIEQKFAKEEDL